MSEDGFAQEGHLASFRRGAGDVGLTIPVSEQVLSDAVAQVSSLFSVVVPGGVRESIAQSGFHEAVPFTDPVVWAFHVSCMRDTEVVVLVGAHLVFGGQEGVSIAGLVSEPVTPAGEALALYNLEKVALGTELMESVQRSVLARTQG